MSQLVVRSLIAVLLVLAGSCNGCVGSNQATDASSVEAGPMPESVPLPGAVYRDAFDAAKQEITPDNAWDRLDQMERQVLRERSDLQ